MRRRTIRRPRRKRTYRRKRQLRIARPIRRQRVFSYKQFVEKSNIVLSTTSQNTYFAYSFKNSDMDQATTFNGLYDQYRICAIKITFYPPYNVSYLTPTTSSYDCPQIYTVVDNDTQTVPTSLAQLLQYQSMKRKYFNRPHSRYFRPGSVSYATLTSVSGEYAFSQNSHRLWIDCGSPNALYYGILGAIVYTSSTQVVPANTYIRVSCTYYVQFKNVR